MSSSSSPRSVREADDAAVPRRPPIDRSRRRRTDKKILRAVARAASSTSPEQYVKEPRDPRCRPIERIGRENEPGAAEKQEVSRNPRAASDETAASATLRIASPPVVTSSPARALRLSILIRASDIPLRDKRREEGSAGFSSPRQPRYSRFFVCRPATRIRNRRSLRRFFLEMFFRRTGDSPG